MMPGQWFIPNQYHSIQHCTYTKQADATRNPPVDFLMNDSIIYTRIHDLTAALLV